MSRYFFNVRRGETIFEDHVGVLLAGTTEAWSYAVKDALALIREGHIDSPMHRYWMEVCDAKHCAVVSFPIGRVTMH